MVFKVITQERGDEVIAVVVAGLHAQRQGVARGLARGGWGNPPLLQGSD